MNDYQQLYNVFLELNEQNILQIPSDLISNKDKNLFNLKQHMEDIEKSMLKSALDKYSGNQQRASAYLCMNRTTFIEKIKKFKIKWSDS